MRWDGKMIIKNDMHTISIPYSIQENPNAYNIVKYTEPMKRNICVYEYVWLTIAQTQIYLNIYVYTSILLKV